MGEIEKYLEKIKEIQSKVLNYIENTEVDENNFKEIIKICDEYKIQEDKNDFKLFLYLLNNISNNHHRDANFFDKFFKILKYYQDYIQNNFTNDEIFIIFQKNKRILLFLFEEKIITITKKMITTFSNYKFRKGNFLQFFSNEINVFDRKQNDNSEDFEEKRKIGENDSFICQLIREDKIDEFVSHINQSNLNIKTFEINPSIFETNSFLVKKTVSLIEYSAFFGSIQIFNYLLLNGAELKPNLFLYAIHSNNQEIFHLLEEKKVKFISEKYLKEAIKCHHFDIENYIIENYFQKINFHDFLPKFLKFYNFHFITSELLDKSSIYDLFKYNYFDILKKLLKDNRIDINEEIISKFKIF